MFMCEDGTPTTILAGYDGTTTAFFANVVPCKGTSHGYAERALAVNVFFTSTMNARHQAGTHIPDELIYEESPIDDSSSNGSIERPNQTIRGQIRAEKITEDGAQTHQRQTVQTASVCIRRTDAQGTTSEFRATGSLHSGWADAGSVSTCVEESTS